MINHYPIALTKSAADSQAAQAFIDYVLSPEGQKVLQDTYGFGAPGATSGTTATPTATPAAPGTPAETGTPAPAATSGAAQTPAANN